MTQKAVGYKGSECTTGHGCTTITNIDSGSLNVIIGGTKSVARKDDSLVDHLIDNPGIIPPCIDHLNQKVNEGSASVFVNDRPIARVGDSVDVAGEITEGFSSVVAGG